ncbi:hypothetical protein EV424DRAFT_1344718 [Suillus variegatus]|nr:hypothetical protein EV424DRAFT_1344718 [Suillus variegatus]
MSAFIPPHDAHGLSHNYYIYDVMNDLVLPSSGEPATSLNFVGYLAVGLLPTVYALYLRAHLCLVSYIRTPMLHASTFLNPRADVPCYVLILDFSTPPLNLPCLMMVDETNPLRGTVVHLVHYPTGYHKVTNEDLMAFSDILTASGQGTSIYSQSWICSESTNGNAASTSSTIGLRQNAAIPAQPQASTSADHTIGAIMQANDQWQYPLAHIRMLIRIAVCCGAMPNPHLLALTTEHGQRVEIIRQLWPLSLMRSEVDPSTLETVLSKVTKKPLSQNDILDFAVPWFSQFSYDVRRKLHDTLDDSRAGFGLRDSAYGDVLIDKILDCTRMFIRPWANMLPLSENGFYRFLIHQIAKEIVYHVVFRSQETCDVRLTIADLEPTKFRNAPHPPWEALTFFTSSCYEVLLKRLSHYPNCDTLLATFPCPSQVFSELKEMGPILLQQHNDPDIQLFRQTLRSLTLITRHSKNYQPTQRPTTPILHVLEIEQTEAALLGWLQMKSCDTLPESLVITASVVFGLVDAHDLTALIDISSEKRGVVWYSFREKDGVWCKIKCIELKWKSRYSAMLSRTCVKNLKVEITPGVYSTNLQHHSVYCLQQFLYEAQLSRAMRAMRAPFPRFAMYTHARVPALARPMAPAIQMHPSTVHQASYASAPHDHA